ncbi:YqaE/Pmp3 family membrane protein [bacterium]|nr:YqaE/Pmp3 family membrane protein [bacterium]
MDAKDLIILLVTIFLPPLGVAIKFGFGINFWLNLALTLFGYVPGLIHGVYVVLKG